MGRLFLSMAHAATCLHGIFLIDHLSSYKSECHLETESENIRQSPYSCTSRGSSGPLTLLTLLCIVELVIEEVLVKSLYFIGEFLVHSVHDEADELTIHDWTIFNLSICLLCCNLQIKVM